MGVVLWGLVSAAVSRVSKQDPAWKADRDVELCSRLFETSPTAKHRERLADALRRRGSLRLSQSPQESVTDFDRCIELVDDKAELVRCLTGRGYAHYHAGRLDEALSDFDRATSVLSTDDAPELEGDDEVSLRAGRADALAALRRYEEAVRDYDTAIRTYRDLIDEGRRRDLSASLAATLNHRGYALDRTGRKAEAESDYSRAAEIYRSVLDDGAAESSYHAGLAMSWTGSGCVLGSVERFEEAVAAHTQAIRLLERIQPSPTSGLGETLALNYSGRGVCLARSGDSEGAKEDLDAAIGIYSTLIESGSTDLDKERELVRRERKKLGEY